VLDYRWLFEVAVLAWSVAWIVPPRLAGRRRSLIAADRAIRVSTAGRYTWRGVICSVCQLLHRLRFVPLPRRDGITSAGARPRSTGLVYSSSMVVLTRALHRLPLPRPWLAAAGPRHPGPPYLAANGAHWWSHGPSLLPSRPAPLVRVGS